MTKQGKILPPLTNICTSRNVFFIHKPDLRRILAPLLLAVAFAGAAFAQADLRVTHVFPSPYVKPGTHTFVLAVQNIGSQGAAFRIYWQLDNGVIKNASPGVAAIGGNGTVKAANDTFQFTVATPGTAKLKVWVKTLNGVPDVNTANDTLTRTLKVMPNLPDKNVILEVYKHQACGPCYPAAEFNHANVETLPNHMVVNLYTSTSDVLYNADAAAINTLYSLSHPAPIFDRFKFPYLHDIPTGYYTLNSNFYLREFGSRDVHYEPLGVTIVSQTIDTTTRVLKVRLKAKAVDTMSGDLRFNLWVTEDSINAYQASAPNPNNYWHKGVLRHFLGGQWGVQGSLPSTMLPGQEVTYDFQYTLPSTWKLRHLKTIGLVQTYTADAYARRIVNSVWIKTLTPVTSVSEIAATASAKLYPNPATDRLWVEMDDAADIRDAMLSVLNSAGQVVLRQAIHRSTETIDLRMLPAGAYWLRVGNGAAQAFVKQ